MDEQTQQTEQQTSSKKSGFPKVIVGAAVLLLLAGAGYWAVTSGAVDLNSLTKSDSVKFAATVNGEGIENRLLDIRFEQTKNNYQAQGLPFEETELRERVLVDMIDERLLIQYAKEQGIQENAEAVETQYQQIIGQFETEEQFFQQIESQSTTVEDIKTSIGEQLIIQQLVEQVTRETVIEISSEEVQAAYDQAVASGVEAPPLEEVQPQVEEALRQQKVTQLMEALVEQLRQEGTVEILS